MSMVRVGKGVVAVYYRCMQQLAIIILGVIDYRTVISLDVLQLQRGVGLLIDHRDDVGLQDHCLGVAEHLDVILGGVVLGAGSSGHLLARSQLEVEVFESEGTGLGGAGSGDGEQLWLEVEGGSGVVEQDVAGIDGHLPAVDVLGDVDGAVDALVHVEAVGADCQQYE